METTQVTFVLDNDTLSRVDAVAAQEERPRSAVLRMAAKKFVSQQNRPQEAK